MRKIVQKEYNGYYNRATWLVAMNLFGNEGTCRTLLEQVRHTRDRRKVARMIRTYCHELGAFWARHDEPDLTQVYWREIGLAFVEAARDD